MPRRPNRGRIPIVVVAVGLVLLAGCGVTTTVGVRVRANGSGDVSVKVVLDRQAVTEVGGLAGQLQTSDLVTAGWVVKGPAPGPAGGEVVTVTHTFARIGQVRPLLAEVASSGSGAPASYAVTVRQSASATGKTTTAVGHVDLRCGLSCFGDAGLRRTFGSPVGVNASAFAGAAGMASARQDFVFRFTLTLPGQVVSTNATSRSGGTLQWKPVLGRTVRMRASSTIVDPPKAKAHARPASRPSPGPRRDGRTQNATVVIAAVVAGAIVIAGLVLTWRLVRRRRRTRLGTT